MALDLREVFNTEAIAAYQTSNPSNRIPYLLQAYFPNRKKMGIDLKWLKIHRGLSVALKPSNFDALPVIRPRGNVNMTQTEMPLFRESKLIKEVDLAELARIKDMNDPYLQPVIDSIYNDVEELLDSAEVSAEWLRAQLIAPEGGKLTIKVGATDNMIYSYNYDTDGSWEKNNYTELQGTSTWDKDTATPLDDIQGAQQYLESIDARPTTIISNSATFNLLTKNDQIKNSLITITGRTVDFMNGANVKEVLRGQLGLEYITYDKMFIDYEGKQRKFYPDGYITILGGAQLGNTWRGSTPEELTTTNNFMGLPQAPVDIRVLDNGVAVAIQNEYKPSFTVTTTASQIVLPSYEGMDSVYVIKVLGSE